jgi:hypothetical protein
MGRRTSRVVDSEAGQEIAAGAEDMRTIMAP